MVSGSEGDLSRPAVFFDRDGVLTVPQFAGGRSYAPRRIEDFRLYPEALDCVRQVRAAGAVAVVVTNQPDVGNGLVSRDLINSCHDLLRQDLPVDAIYVCCHAQGDGCDCRKPAPGMLLQAAVDLDIDLGRSVMIGDRGSDVEAGRRAGCRTIFIDLGYDAESASGADRVVRNLTEATEAALAFLKF